MKKKTLLGSIITIVLCLSIIAGSTFALFTDKKSFNIAATSADVEIHASAGINQLYSATYAGDGIDAEDRFLIDEDKNNYVHQAMGGEGSLFLNGGTAEVVDGNLSIYRLTPGDRVDVNILVENRSDVSIIYRYKIEAKDSNLATAMVVTVDNTDNGTPVKFSYEGLKSYVSPWFSPVATDGNGNGYPVPTKTLSFELPVYANDDFQTEYVDKTHTTGDIESVEYVITVEAVQANAKKDNESEAILYPNQNSIVDAIDNAVDGATINIDGDGATFDSPDGFILRDNPIIFNDITVNTDDPYLLVNDYFDEDVLDPDGFDLTFDNNAVLETAENDQSLIFAAYADSASITVKNGSKIKVNTPGSFGIVVHTSNVDLYIDSLDCIELANGGLAFDVYAAGTLTIHVVDDAMKTAMEALVADPAYACGSDAITVVVG